MLRGTYERDFGKPRRGRLVRAPGRINLIGEHIDYNGLPVLPMAIQRQVTILFEGRDDGVVHFTNTDCRYPPRKFLLSASIPAGPGGDWGNYLKAAAQTLVAEFGDLKGIQGTVSSDIPVAAGLSSSSALVVACALALIHANDLTVDTRSLMSLLAKGECYVGTQGGGMDQAICLGGQKDRALKIHFDPLELHPVAIPAGWRFVLSNSQVTAEKSGRVQTTYNLRTEECRRALDQVKGKLNLDPDLSYSELMDRASLEYLLAASRELDDPIGARLRHVVTEAGRVGRAALALTHDQPEVFGNLMTASHQSLRDDYEVSCKELDTLVEIATAHKARGARLTGAGFGGCVIALCATGETDSLIHAIRREYYAKRGTPANADSVMLAVPSDGARVREL